MGCQGLQLFSASVERFRAELFHFGTASRKMGAELYMLKDGVYEMTLRDSAQAGRKYLDRQKIEVKGPRTRISFEIPPSATCVLSLRKVGDK